MRTKNVKLAPLKDTLSRALFAFLPSGMKLKKETEGKELVDMSYNQSPDAFSVMMKIAGMAANVPLKPMRGDQDSDVDPLKEYFESNSSDKTFYEHRLIWHLFSLALGEAIVYVPIGKVGNNAGKITLFKDVPPQNVEIITGGWREPIKNYIIDINERERFNPEDIWHTRIFPTLTDWENGEGFRGHSPIKNAANIIKVLNNGYELQAILNNEGMPPGMLIDKAEGLTDPMAESNQKRFEKLWRRKQRNPDRKQLPFYSGGNLAWESFSNGLMQDLDLINSSQQGLRVLCRCFGVDSKLFNDPSASTMNNQKSAEGQIYTNRIMPDINAYVEGINSRIKATGIQYKADYSEIKSLQHDRKEMSDILLAGIDKGAAKENEWREMMKLEKLTPEELDELRTERSARRNFNLPENMM